jgi:uncharacterized protein (TIGR02687 family)
VLFLFDPDIESLEEVQQLEPDGYRIVFYEYNDFRLKLKFHDEWLNEKVFLYMPVKRPEKQEEYLKFPLLDLLTANRELRLDDVGEFMDEFQLKRMHRPLVQKYIRELKYTTVQKVAAKVLRPGNFEEKELQKALISAFLRFGKVESKELLLAKILTLGLNDEETELNRFRNKITTNQLMDTLDSWVSEYFGEKLSEVSQERLKQLAAKLKYNALTAGMETDAKDPYESLKINSAPVLNNLLALKEHALFNPALCDQFNEALTKLTRQVRAQKMVEVYGVHGGFAWLNPELVSEMQAAVVKKMSTDPMAEVSLLEQIFTWEGLEGNLLQINNFLFHTAQTLQQIRQANNRVLDHPEEYVQQYTQVWYKIDTSYRKAVLAYSLADFSGSNQVDLFQMAKDNLETAYLTFTGKINREWLRCLAEHDFDYPSLNIPLQFNFYQENIAPLDQKMAVVISDALRYEVAAELMKEIHKDTKSEVHIQHCLASVPSTTAVGMSNLLPGKDFKLEGKTILADGISADATNREKVLQNANSDSRTITFSRMKELSEKERREVFKAQVVYVYHDVIDAIGHKRPTEEQTFRVIESTALSELAWLVKHIHATLAVARVIVTADHGFIYNDRSIAEKEFEPSLPGDANINTLKNRHGILETWQKPESGYCIPFNKVNKIKSDAFVLIPDGVNRYHRQGAGTRFVHGGGSLQELVVPVIESRRKTIKAVQKVNPILLTMKLTVVSNTLKLQILQENPVSNTEKERTIKLGLYDGNDLVSNLPEVQLNETSEQPSKRISNVSLVLLPGQADKPRFTLRVFDPEDPLNRLIEKDVDNSTLYGTDF